MSMNLAKKIFSTRPDYLIAGTVEIVTAVKEVVAVLKRSAPTVLDSFGKLTAVTVSGGAENYKTEATGLYGVLAEDVKSGERDAVYLSGESFADALVLPANDSTVGLKVPLRALGIFLK